MRLEHLLSGESRQKTFARKSKTKYGGDDFGLVRYQSYLFKYYEKVRSKLLKAAGHLEAEWWGEDVEFHLTFSI